MEQAHERPAANKSALIATLRKETALRSTLQVPREVKIGGRTYREGEAVFVPLKTGGVVHGTLLEIANSQLTIEPADGWQFRYEHAVSPEREDLPKGMPKTSLIYVPFDTIAPIH